MTYSYKMSFPRLSSRLISIVFLFLAISNLNAQVSLKKLWCTESGLSVPESVLFNSAKDILYVSNIDGKPLEKNGKGFISIISKSGKIKKLKWIKGLNAPKGMAINGPELYVTDIDHLVIIDIEKSKVIKKIFVESSKFLNDIAIDGDGNLYISDNAAGKIFSLRTNGKITTWLEIEAPNGIHYNDAVLYVGNFSSGGISVIDIKSKKSLETINTPGGVDGLKPFKDSFIVTDWSGKTSLVSNKNQVLTLVNTTSSKIQSADIEFIPEESLLLIPTFFGNTVCAYKLIESDAKK